MQVQCRGVADALGLSYLHKRVAPRGIYRLLSPWLMPARSDQNAIFEPPWPDVAIATGRLSIPYVRALSRLAGPKTYTIVLQDPRTGLGTADLIWVPQHDRLRGASVITSLTAPHSYSPAELSRLRASTPAQIAALPSPRVTVLLGGDGGGYKFSAADAIRLAGAIGSLAALKVSFMITPSRRTPAFLLRTIDDATRSRPRVLWGGEGENPYAGFLAHADVLVVTADSVNMTGEASATGRPVYVFAPSGGSEKFVRFHISLQQHGATRPLPDRPIALEDWSYKPLHSAGLIAAEIERRWRWARMASPSEGRGTDNALRQAPAP
jgi:uncharacterized protein